MKTLFRTGVVYLAFLLCVFSTVHAQVDVTLQNATITPSGSGNGVAMNVKGLVTLGIGIIGSSGADRVVNFEASQDGTNYLAISCTNMNSLASATTATTSSTTLQLWRCGVGGMSKFRARLSGGSTGTTTVTATGLSTSAGGGGGQSLSTTSSPTFTAILAGDGSASAPSYSFTNAPTMGMYARTSTILAFSVGNAERARMTGNVITLRSDGVYQFSSTTDPSAGGDTGMARNGAGIVEINNGTAGTYRDVKVRQMFSDPPTAQTIAGGNTVTADACGGLKELTSAGGVTTDTTNTFTAPAAANKGCIMYVCNTGANNITLDNNALFKSKAGADVVLTAEDCITVGSNGSAWRQLTDIVSAN